MGDTVVDCSSGHICGFFNGREELYRFLLPFTKEGVIADDRVIHIDAPSNRNDHVARLENAGIDVAGAQRAEQLTVFNWEEAYLRKGQFDQHAMLELVDEVLAQSRLEGYGMTRLSANMEWALEGLPGVQDLIEYEARANYILPKYGDAVI